jgi:hypothetical protein
VTPAVDGLPVVLGEPTPNAVGLTDLERVSCAQVENGAATADRLRGGLAGLACRAALPVGMEERARIVTAAGSVELPVPEVSIGSGEAGNVGHAQTLQTFHKLVKMKKGGRGGSGLDGRAERGGPTMSA